MRRRIVHWIIIAVAVPIVVNLLRKSGERVAQARGPDSKAARGLRAAGSAVRYVK